MLRAGPHADGRRRAAREEGSVGGWGARQALRRKKPRTELGLLRAEPGLLGVEPDLLGWGPDFLRVDPGLLSSIQFSSVAQSCPTLCGPRG